jgi:hypothetical protein
MRTKQVKLAAAMLFGFLVDEAQVLPYSHPFCNEAASAAASGS